MAPPAPSTPPARQKFWNAHVPALRTLLESGDALGAKLAAFDAADLDVHATMIESTKLSRDSLEFMRSALRWIDVISPPSKSTGTYAELVDLIRRQIVADMSTVLATMSNSETVYDAFVEKHCRAVHIGKKIKRETYDDDSPKKTHEALAKMRFVAQAQTARGEIFALCAFFEKDLANLQRLFVSFDKSIDTEGMSMHG